MKHLTHPQPANLNNAPQNPDPQGNTNVVKFGGCHILRRNCNAMFRTQIQVIMTDGLAA